MPVAASWKDILLLIENIKNNLKNLENNNNIMEEQLYRLGITFKDEGIEIIRNHIANTKKQIEDTISSFDTVLKNMVTYAFLLKKAEDSIPQNERYFPGI